MHLPVDAERKLRGLHEEAHAQQAEAQGKGQTVLSSQRFQMMDQRRHRFRAARHGQVAGQATDAHKDEARAADVEAEILESLAQREGIAFMGQDKVERPGAHDLPEQEEAEEGRRGGHAYQAAAHGREGAVEAPLTVAMAHVAQGIDDVERAHARHQQGKAEGQRVQLPPLCRHEGGGQQEHRQRGQPGLARITPEKGGQQRAEDRHRHIEGPDVPRHEEGGDVEHHQGQEPHEHGIGAGLGHIPQRQGDELAVNDRTGQPVHQPGGQPRHKTEHGQDEQRQTYAQGSFRHRRQVRRTFLENQRLEDADIVDRPHQRTGKDERGQPDVTGLRHGLDHEIFAEEAPERRQAHDGDEAHAHAGHGPRHGAAEAAQIRQLPRTGAQDERPRSEEEQILHDGVHTHMGQRRVKGGQGPHAQHKGDLAQLAQSGEGQHTLDVLLTQGHDLAVNKGEAPHEDKGRAVPAQAVQPFLRSGGSQHPEQDQAVDTHLGDDARQRRGHGRGRRRVRIRQPGMQRDQTGLDGESGQTADHAHLQEFVRHLGQQGCRKGHGAAADERQTRQEQERAARAHEVVLETGVIGRAPTLVHHEEIGCEGHQLPVAVKGIGIGRTHDARQCRKGQRQEKPVPGRMLVVSHVVHGVKTDNHGYQTDQRKEDQRQALERRMQREEENADERQHRGQHHGPGRKAAAPQAARAAEDSPGVEQPEGDMRQGMAHLAQLHEAGEKAYQFIAGQPQRTDHQGQQDGDQTDLARRKGGCMRIRRFQQGDADGMEVQSQQGQRTGRGQQAEAEARIAGQSRVEEGIGKEQARFGDEEGRTAHAGHEAQSKQRPGRRTYPSRPAQGRQGRLGAVGQIGQRGQRQQAACRLKRHIQEHHQSRGHPAAAQRKADHARIDERAPADQAFQVLALSHGQPGSEKKKEQSRQKKYRKVGNCDGYGHTRPGRWLPASSALVPARCATFATRETANSKNG